MTDRTIPYLVKDARPGLATHGAVVFLAFAAADGTARRVVLVLTASSGDRVAGAASLPALPRFSAEEAGRGDMA